MCCQVINRLVQNLWLFLRRQSCCRWKKLDRRQWRLVRRSGSKCTWMWVVDQPICRPFITLLLTFLKGLCYSVTELSVYDLVLHPLLYDSNHNKYVRLRGWPYISTHADPTCGQHTGQIGQRIGHAHMACKPAWASWPAHVSVLADSSDFGLLGEQSSPKCEIPRPGHR